MNTKHHFRFLISLFFFGFLFLGPGFQTKALASPYLYQSIGEILGSKVVIGQSGLDPETYATCDIGTLSCEQNGEILPQLNPLDAATEAKNHFWNLQKDRIFVSEEVLSSKKSTVVQNTIYSVKGGQATLESILPTHEHVFRAIFSADNTRVILITRDNYLVSVNLVNKTVVFKKPFVDKDLAGRLTLSPNGKFLAYYIPAYTSTNVRQFKLWDLAENKLYALTSNVLYWDLLSEDLKIFEFSPDSSTLVYLDDRDNFPTLYKVNLKNSNAISLAGEKLFAKDYTVADFIFGDNSTLYFTANRESPLTWSLYKFDLTSSSLLKIEDGISYTQMIRKIGSSLLFLKTDSEGAHAEVWNTKTKTVAALPIERNVSQKEKPEDVGEIVSFNGMSAVLLKPETYNPKKTYPLLIWLHGGPYRQTSAEYHPYISYAGYDEILKEAQRNGVVVLKLDYNGSYGYGRSFAESIKTKWAL